MGFVDFIKYSVYDWVNTFCCTKMQWKYGNQIDEIREEIIWQMEVNRFYKRILNTETAVTYDLGESKMDFVKLVQPSATDQVKNREVGLS